jgi:hypothetical protein
MSKAKRSTKPPPRPTRPARKRAKVRTDADKTDTTAATPKPSGKAKRLGAGDAFAKRLREHPGDLAGVLRAPAKLRAFGQAVAMTAAPMQAVARHIAELFAKSDADRERRLAALDEELRREWNACNAGWEQTFGEPYPKTPEDVRRLAERAGMDFNDARRGDWTYAEIFPLVEGYLLRLLDGRKTDAATRLINSGGTGETDERPGKRKRVGEICKALLIPDKQRASAVKKLERARNKLKEHNRPMWRDVAYQSKGAGRKHGNWLYEPGWAREVLKN